METLETQTHRRMHPNFVIGDSFSSIQKQDKTTGAGASRYYPPPMTIRSFI